MSEKGNALFLILIAVALFAALGYAVTQSSRGGGAGVDEEKASLTASELVQYTTSIRTAIQRMTLKGVDPNDILFKSTATGPNALFAPEGGGVTFQLPPDGTLSSTQNPQDYLFTSYFKVQGVGTAAADWVLFFWVAQDAFGSSVCEAVDSGLGLSVPPGIDSGAINDSFDGYDGEHVA